MSSHQVTPSVDALLRLYFPDTKVGAEVAELPQMQPEVVSGLGFRNELQPGDIKISKTLQRLKRSDSKDNTFGSIKTERSPASTKVKQHTTNEMKKQQNFTGKKVRPRKQKSFNDKILGKRA